MAASEPVAIRVSEPVRAVPEQEGPTADPAGEPIALTRREDDAAALLAEGCGRTELAAGLGVSVSAADKLVRSLKTKLGASSRVELAIRSREWAHERPASRSTRSAPIGLADAGHAHTGHAHTGHAPRQGEMDDAFADASDLDALFARLHTALAPLGVTHLAYSHLRWSAGGRLEHMASRWSFPPEIAFDHAIPADENLAFRHAMTSWKPAPLDLEAMMASDFYAYVPEPVRKQNEVFLAAGMVRGITFALPGVGVSDRLVLSMLLQHASEAAFAAFLVDATDRAHLLALAFRHAHVALAKPRLDLNARETELLERLADGQSIDQAAAALNLSRRVADRLLAGARSATGRASNAGALAAWLRDRSEPALPF